MKQAIFKTNSINDCLGFCRGRGYTRPLHRIMCAVCICVYACLLGMASATANEKPDVYYPSTGNQGTSNASSSDDGRSPEALPPPSTWVLFSQVVVFLILMGGAAFYLRNYAKGGGLKMKSRKGGGPGLVIAETKTLGNKQFLVVVEYGAQKMLIGVAPGTINHLCYLNNAYDDKAAFEDGEVDASLVNLPPEIRPDE